MVFGGKTDIGLWREENQDAFKVKRIGKYVVGVVCDGMGGAKGGSIASAKAVESFMDYLDAELPKAKNEDELIASLTEAASAANTKVFSYAVENPYFFGMGTTLVSFLKTEETLFVLNIGDSRCYTFKNGKLKLVTKDHSLVQHWIDMGMITEEEANEHPKRNVITKAVGTDTYVSADVFKETEYDSVLLCSDGLTKCTDEKKIEKIMSEGKDADTICDQLVEAAKSDGGTDNITVIVLKDR